MSKCTIVMCAFLIRPSPSRARSRRDRSLRERRAVSPEHPRPSSRASGASARGHDIRNYCGGRKRSRTIARASPSLDAARETPDRIRSHSRRNSMRRSLIACAPVPCDPFGTAGQFLGKCIASHIEPPLPHVRSFRLATGSPPDVDMTRSMIHQRARVVASHSIASRLWPQAGRQANATRVNLVAVCGPGMESDDGRSECVGQPQRQTLPGFDQQLKLGFLGTLIRPSRHRQQSVFQCRGTGRLPLRLELCTCLHPAVDRPKSMRSQLRPADSLMFQYSRWFGHICCSRESTMPTGLRIVVSVRTSGPPRSRRP